MTEPLSFPQRPNNNKDNGEGDAPANKMSLIPYFAAVAIAGASVAAIVLSDSLYERKGPAALDSVALSYFGAQGYDVVKRTGYKAFENKEVKQGEEAGYTLRERETGTPFTGALTCGRQVLPDMLMPRTCYVQNITPGIKK